MVTCTSFRSGHPVTATEERLSDFNRPRKRQGSRRRDLDSSLKEIKMLVAYFFKECPAYTWHWIMPPEKDGVTVAVRKEDSHLGEGCVYGRRMEPHERGEGWMGGMRKGSFKAKVL